jgi:hypothetical protein
MPANDEAAHAVSKINLNILFLSSEEVAAAPHATP